MKMKTIPALIVAAILCSAIFAGCEKEIDLPPVSGTVVFHGENSELQSCDADDRQTYLECFSGTVIRIEDDSLLLATGMFSDAGEVFVKVKTDGAKNMSIGDFIHVKSKEIIAADPIIVEAESVEAVYSGTEDYKPVIYFYPDEEKDVTVRMDIEGRLTCTYPVYNGAWQFTARQDGTLVFPNGREYYCLFWEGVTDSQAELSTGFCVRGEDTAAFLEQTLKTLGLTEREANEFIIYWMPQMQDNAYNIISFDTENYLHAVKLEITPRPDSMLRVFMTYKASDVPVDIPVPELARFERNGFAVVEWGGCEVK